MKGQYGKHKMYNTRKTSSLYKDNAINEVHKLAVETLRNIQSAGCLDSFRGGVSLWIHIKGKTQADGDNIFKGIADALQGIIFENDKQIREGYFRFES